MTIDNEKLFFVLYAIRAYYCILQNSCIYELFFLIKIRVFAD